MTAHTLVLNASYEPLKVVDWMRAVTLWYGGKAEIVAEHDRVVHSPKTAMKIPSVVRLLYFVKVKRRPVVQFTRVNVYARDGGKCQYCGEGFAFHELTFDHVIPAAQGGTRSFDNIVTACEPCNKKKGARTPEQAGMQLLRHPRRPLVLPHESMLTVGYRLPETWKPYMFAARA